MERHLDIDIYRNERQDEPYFEIIVSEPETGCKMKVQGNPFRTEGYRDMFNRIEAELYSWIEWMADGHSN